LWLESQNLVGLSDKEIETYILHGALTNKELEHAVNTKLSDKHKKMLNLCSDWLRSFLPHVLQKIDRVSFGILTKAEYDRAVALDPHMPQSRSKLAIPFVGKDVPSRSSEFAHPDVIIGLTILAYRYEGVRWSDFEDIIVSLRNSMLQEFGPYNERSSSIRYAKWVREAGGRIKGAAFRKEELEALEGNNQSDAKDKKEEKALIPVYEMNEEDRVEVVPLRLLKRSNEEQMTVLYNLINKLPDMIHWYLENIIFPRYMRNQVFKISASAQEVGGDMLFGRRIGFSGTPSDLLPIELGRCGYEKGSDGQVLSVMTTPDICDYTLIEENWSVHSILDRIAKSENPRYHALIDTGALITGMSNHDVARYLLDKGLSWCDGVVFLDEFDRKMILVRATGRVVKLETCGVPLERRFAFYDQIHTTGMDIKHVLNARAVLTLGKDMVWRDYAQGAYRMRGIAQGQTIQLFIIPEIERLIQRELKQAKITSSLTSGPKKVLEDVAAWLVINSMRLERIQFNMLCLQNVSNVYRKRAYVELLKGFKEFRAKERIADKYLLKCNAVFKEDVDFSLEAAVPHPKSFKDVINHHTSEFKEFIVGDDWKVIEDVSKVVSDSIEDVSENHFNAEMVREQEQEQEQQREQQQEKELELEKFEDKAYSREQEEQKPWPFKLLKQSVQENKQFAPLNQFHLYKRRPVSFPPYTMFSNNYFDPTWSGDRRIKNVVMVLEWVPTLASLKDVVLTAEALSDVKEAALQKTFAMFDVDKSGDLSLDEMKLIIRSAMDVIPSDDDLKQVAREFSNQNTGKIGLNEVRALLTSGKFRKEESGRHMVAVSLAEAETIRRILHIRLDKPPIDNADTSVALRCLPAEYSVFDASCNYVAASDFQSEVVRQSLRFFDCDMYYKESQLNILLRALNKSSIRERLSFFTQIIGCRRRLDRKWEETPLAKVFTLPDEFHLLKQRAQAVRAREAIKQKGLLLWDAFRMFDYNNDGRLSLAEMYGALDWLGIELTPADILDFVNACPHDKEMNIDYKNFVEILRDPDVKEDDDSASADSSKDVKNVEFTRIQPKGEKELLALKETRALESKKEDDMLKQKEAEEEAKIRSQIEEEEYKKDLQAGGAPNPLILVGDKSSTIRFDFTTGRAPRGMGTRGDYAFKPADGRKFVKVFPNSELLLPVQFSKNAGGEALNQYTITMECKLDALPSQRQALFACYKPTAAQTSGVVAVDNTGGVGAGGSYGYDSARKLKKDKWHIVSVSVDCIAGQMITFVDGKLLANIKIQELTKDGPFSLSGQILLFGSRNNKETQGGNCRFLMLETRALSNTDVSNLYETIEWEGSWNCDFCTGRNKASAMRCNICGNDRPSEVSDLGFQCPTCTYINKSGDKCQVCDTPRPEATKLTRQLSGGY